MSTPLAFSYIRFSSKQQAMGHSLKRQTDLAKSYADVNGLALQDTSFQDLGISAFNSANSNEDSGLGQFVAACESGRIPQNSYLLVESLDRLSRDNVDVAMSQLLRITSFHINVVTLFDGKVFKKGMDMMDIMWSLMSMQRAHEESVVKSKRVKAAWAAKRENHSLKRTAACPFWLELNSDGVTYAQKEKWVQLVNHIFGLSIKGYGLVRISHILNEEGYRTVTGQLWNQHSVWSILNDKKAIGVQQFYVSEGKIRTPIGEPVANYYPRIIDEQTYYLSQARLSERKKTFNKGSTSTHKNIYIDIARCAKCGSKMVLQDKGCTYIQCSMAKRKACDAKMIRIEIMHKFLREVWLSPRFFETWAKADEAVNGAEQVESIEAELEKKTKAFDNFMSMDVDFSNSIISKQIQNRTLELDQLDKELEQAKAIAAMAKTSPCKSLTETTQLLGLACKPESEPLNIEARIQVKKLLTYSGIALDVLFHDQQATITLHDENMKKSNFEVDRETYGVMTYISFVKPLLKKFDGAHIFTLVL